MSIACPYRLEWSVLSYRLICFRYVSPFRHSLFNLKLLTPSSFPKSCCFHWIHALILRKPIVFLRGVCLKVGPNYLHEIGQKRRHRFFVFSSSLVDSKSLYSPPMTFYFFCGGTGKSSSSSSSSSISWDLIIVITLINLFILS